MSICQNNTFGNNCENNNFKNNCFTNTFGNNCDSNTFGYNCTDNSFGIDCHDNTFGNNCVGNTFGNDCHGNTFGTDTTASTKATYYQYNKIDSGVQYVNLYNGDTASANNQVQNYHIVAGVLGTGSSYVNVPATRNLAYETKVAKNSAGELKIYCEADLIQ